MLLRGIRRRRTLASSLAVLVLAAGLSACSSAASTKHTGRVRIVAAENSWGSIAEQVGGPDVSVTSIITNPAADPHDYEPTPADARSVAGADLVIVNGVGYDSWASKLLAASPGPAVIDIGELVGAKDGDNPHRWYQPADIHAFVAALARELGKLSPATSAAFDRGRTSFEKQDLQAYHGLIASIRRTYAGTKVGASESIVSMLAPSLGLDVITPSSFLKAISEGTDVTAADKTTIDRQIAGQQIKVYIFNDQNATPDIQAQLAACGRQGIPTAIITETLTPASASFQQWQVTQLQGIRAALAKATGR